MGQLAVFIPDGETRQSREKIGTGSCTYFHFRPPKGPFRFYRQRRQLSRMAAGFVGADPVFCAMAGIPCLSGDAAVLVHAGFLSLVPQDAERITLFPGTGYRMPALEALSRRVRFLEIAASPQAEAIAQALQAETGQCIPVCRRPSPRFLPLRLPGAPSGNGIDLTAPEAACVFLPPPPLRTLWQYVPHTGATLAALLAFFGFKAEDSSIFLSNFTKF